MATRLKLKSSVKIIIVVIIFLIIAIFAFVKIRKNYLYHQSYQYKLLNVGYSDQDIKLLEKYYNENELYILSTKPKDETMLSLMNQRNYKHKKYERYINYLKSHRNETAADAVFMVNINRDFKFYEKTSLANPDKGNLILVNKYFRVEDTFVPDNLVTISPKYSWGSGKQIKSEVYDAFIEMHTAAHNENENIYLMINLGYRSYEEQESLYNRYKSAENVKYADSITARPGHSEHQTGLALDIFDYSNSNTSTFKNTEAYTWLKENAYKYGFILRYEEGKENITGFEVEDWHYRYVGKTVAKIIHDKDITFEEYYYNEY